MSDSDAPTRTDDLMRRLKDHPVIAIVFVLGAALSGVAGATGAVGDLLDLFVGGDDNGGNRTEYCELIAPLVAQLTRSKAAFDAWNEPNLELERTIKVANETARGLLLEKAALVVPPLRRAADSLVAHYDRWLEEYRDLREGMRADEGLPYVWVGPQGYGFPRHAEVSFKNRLEELEAEVAETPCS